MTEARKTGNKLRAHSKAFCHLNGFNGVLVGVVGIVQSFNAGSEFACDVAPSRIFHGYQRGEKIANRLFQRLNRGGRHGSVPSREETFSLLNDRERSSSENARATKGLEGAVQSVLRLQAAPRSLALREPPVKRSSSRASRMWSVVSSLAPAWSMDWAERRMSSLMKAAETPSVRLTMNSATSSGSWRPRA